jgi:hypothetical protein
MMVFIHGGVILLQFVIDVYFGYEYGIWGWLVAGLLVLYGVVAFRLGNNTDAVKPKVDETDAEKDGGKGGIGGSQGSTITPRTSKSDVGGSASDVNSR